MRDKILHISTDEKFVDSAMFLFEKAFPQRNILRIIKKDSSNELQYVKKGYDNIEFYNEQLFREKDFLADIKNVKYVIFHNIDYFKAEIILNFSKPEGIKYLWIFWGGEVFNNSYFNKGNYISEETKNLLGKDHFIIEKIKFLKRFLMKPFHPHFKLLKAIKKVDAFLGLKSDYDLLAKAGVIEKDLKLINFSYYPMDYIVGESTYEAINSNFKGIVLVGNSSTSSNNHIDVIKKLSQFDTSFKSIFPLSYGDSNYRNIISTEGKRFLGDKYTSLMEYLTLDEYNNILIGCDIAIMNHYRQQAVGNILTLLYVGKKVVLNEQSSLYRYLLDLGLVIFSFSQFKESDFSPLNPEQQLINKRLIKDNFFSLKISEDIKAIEYV